jgi:hypothetical protein
MKRHWIEYHERWKSGPMSYWVHIPIDGKPWHAASEPLPKPVAGCGYPTYYVEINGFTFEFASLQEFRVLVNTFSKKLLPSNLRLSIERGTGYGPSNHWLNRIPKGVTSWRTRQKALKYLRVALKDFEAQSSGR